MTRLSEPSAKHLIFNVDLGAGGRQQLATVVFYPADVDPYESIESQLAAQFSAGPIPSTIMLLGFDDFKDALQQVASDPGLERRVKAISRYQDTPDVRTGVIQSDGSIRVHPAGAEPVNWNRDEGRLLFQTGLAAIFESHKGLINSSAGYHFIKPSGSHSEFFLRGANVLMSNREIYFAAAALLNHLRPDEVLDAIYTDTSSINSLALALSDLLNRLRGAGAPVVESFGSYAGLSAAAPRASGNAICLVSASTSGKLSEEISRTTGLVQDRHIYLYYLGAKPDGLNIACDLTARDDNPVGRLSPIESWTKENCPRCEVGHPTVELIGDNFFPANPTLTPRMIVAKDAPEWLSPFVESVYGLDVIRCHYSDPHTGILESEVHFDLAGIIEPPGAGEPPALSNDLRRLFARSLPAATGVLIHLRDKDSERLAMVAHETLVANGVDRELRVLSASTLADLSSLDIPDGVAVVIASAAASSRSLLEVSQSLRHLHPSGAIAYLVLLARMPTLTQWKEASSNLAYGNGGPNEHPVQALMKVEIPAHEANEQNPWQRERDFWQQAEHRVQYDRALEQRDPHELISARVATIDAAATSGGLRDGLFLPRTIDGNEEALRLRPNFAFWKFRFEGRPTSTASGGASQAEVYFTMQALLHSMRSGRRTRAASLSRDHIWTVLHPRNFARYNDGVIQAALLRAAQPAELNYSTDPGLSRDMSRVIRPILFNRKTEEGAACSEVLFALASRHLRLTGEDLGELIRDLEQEDLAALDTYLTAYIRQVLLD